VKLVVRWFQAHENERFVVEKNRSHIKFMVVDEELVILGSSNFDRASVMTSGEVDIAFRDPGLARSMLAAVEKHQSTGQIEEGDGNV
jgi:phosphatidylserine/phosphatidylglycerophosphate/cardiolipin synthase-like enzyme